MARGSNLLSNSCRRRGDSRFASAGIPLFSPVAILQHLPLSCSYPAKRYGNVFSSSVGRCYLERNKTMSARSMPMRLPFLVCALPMLLLPPLGAHAADLIKAPPTRGLPAICQAQGHSALAREQDFSVIQREIDARYAEARAVSVAISTEASRSERITWAYASRTACGIASGMLSYRELDPDRLWNCECYHARMRATMSR
ncbi:hypothetical protein FHT98_3049 [Bosea sp. AK1]|nr:hypothetical protein FHT98_3049 [Bosea sp. AK1]